MKKPLYILLAALMLFVGGGCKRIKTLRQPAIETSTLRVRVQTIDTLTSRYTHTYVGRVEEASGMNLSIPLGGKVTHIYVKNGQQVEKDQLLLTVDATQTESALRGAEAKLRQAEDGYNRVKQVFNDGAVPEVKMIELETQVEEARSLVTSLRKQLSDSQLRAPQAGVISDCDVHVGTQLLPGQQAMRLLNVACLNAVFTVPENDIASIREGTAATITIPALGDTTFTGKVFEKNLVANPISHTYQVKTSISGTTDMLPGMVCKVQLANQLVGGYIIPASCVETRADGLCVWLVNDGKACRTYIQTTAFVGDGILVTDGLKQGDLLVTQGTNKLYQGAQVEYEER